MAVSQLARFAATKTFKKEKRMSRAHPFLFLVDPGGVEPPSENPLISLSPGAVGLFYLISRYAVRQAYRLTSCFLHDSFNNIRGVHVHCCVTP